MIEQGMNDTDDSDPADCAIQLGSLADLAETVTTGLPAPVRRSLWKVLGRLSTAAVEYPVTLIENAISERKAESNARVRLTEVSQKQISKLMRVDPAYAQAAAEKFAQRIVRERVNVDRIAALAVNELVKLEPPSQASDDPAGAHPDVDEDWLNVFEEEAAKISGEHAQKVFAKILAGEINRPASFSKKTIKLMSQLDKSVAEVFRLACSMSVSMQVPGSIIDARVIGMGELGQNSLSEYGLSYGDCVLLQEYGLVVPELNGYVDYQLCQRVEGSVILPLTYQNEHYFLAKKQGEARSEMRVHGMRFTSSGRELLTIVERQSVPGHVEAMAAFFQQTFRVELTKWVRN